MNEHAFKKKSKYKKLWRIYYADDRFLSCEKGPYKQSHSWELLYSIYFFVYILLGDNIVYIQPNTGKLHILHCGELCLSLWDVPNNYNLATVIALESVFRTF